MENGGEGFMMGYYGNTFGGWGGVMTLTWLLLVVYLVLGIVYFWKGVNKK